MHLVTAPLPLLPIAQKTNISPKNPESPAASSAVPFTAPTSSWPRMLNGSRHAPDAPPSAPFPSTQLPASSDVNIVIGRTPRYTHSAPPATLHAALPSVGCEAADTRSPDAFGAPTSTQPSASSDADIHTQVDIVLPTSYSQPKSEHTCSSSSLSEALPHAGLFPARSPPPCRPNSDPRVNAAPRDVPATPTVSTSLNEDAWSFYLRDYPDPEFVSSIIHIIRHGANLGFTGDKTTSQSCTNLRSAFESPETTASLSADISAQVANGRTAGPFSQPPFTNFRCSPLGAVTRKRSTKIRRIHHLSWPRRRSVNDAIPDSEASIVYDPIDRAVSDIITSGPGSLMVKLDLESAFRHIPVRPEDWHLLGFTWDDNFYYDLVLGFGCRSAPYIFNLFAEALHWILQRHLPAHIRHYLDDFLKIFSAQTPPDVVQKALEWALALGQQLGLHFQPLKIFGPATVLEFLGLEFDTVAMEVRLPAEKLTYLLEFLALWLQRTHCSLHELDELTGFLQFCSQVVPLSRSFIRGLYDFSTEFKTPFTRRRIPKSAHQDIEWWCRFTSEWNGIRFFSPSRPTLHVYTDASGLKGLGGHLGSRWFSVKCPRRYRHEHIQVKEMLAVIHAILCWGDEFAGMHIIFHIDNEAVATAISSFSIRSTPTLRLLRQFLALACRLDFTFTATWLSSKENAIADAASRFAYKRMFELAPHLDHHPSSKQLRLDPVSPAENMPASRPLHITFGMDRRAPRTATQQFALSADAPQFVPKCTSVLTV